MSFDSLHHALSASRLLQSYGRDAMVSPDGFKGGFNFCVDMTGADFYFLSHVCNAFKIPYVSRQIP